MKGPRKGKMKASKKAQTIAMGDRRSRPGLYYGTDKLVPQYDKNGNIIRWIEDPKTVDIKRT